MLSGIGTALDDLGLTDALSQTERKLMAALPEATRGKAAMVADRFHLDPLGWYRKKEETPYVIAIAQAVWADQRISIHYESWKGPVQRDLGRDCSRSKGRCLVFDRTPPDDAGL